MDKTDDYNSKRIREALRFYGAVQGVGFRYRAKYAAQMTGVTGWVRNEPDGSVSMEIQGTAAQIDQVIMTVSRGSWVEIADMTARMIPLDPNEYGFYALYD